MRFIYIFLMGFYLCLGLVANPKRVYANSHCAESYLFLLLDVSGSMAGTRHTAVRNAIKQMTYDFRNKLHFGLATFGANYNLRVPISSTAWSTIRNNVDSYPSNEGYTRMGTAIQMAGQYLDKLKKAEPAATKNRPYYLVLLTDGYPTGDTLIPTTETKTVWQSYGIKTFVIGIEFDANLLNQIAKEGQTGVAYNANDQNSIHNALTQIANTATAEVCDGIDNDCNGLVDELWPDKGKPCTVGIGGCQRTGIWVCKADHSGIECSVKPGNPQPEICDGIDNNCNGQVDENLTRSCNTACGPGTEVCQNGRWANCTAPQAQPERCNDQDDDCNGKIDDPWPDKGKACTAGLGECKRNGIWRCRADGSGLECSAQPGAPQTEICDGKDNDCDGQIDEDWPDKGKACTTGIGACQQTGHYLCKPDGSGIQCSVSGGIPSPEICDGIDNDCNGQIDDGLIRPCKTACGSGIETCVNGKWVNCTALQPQPEICDGKDNDCNGLVDDNLTRPCKTICGEGKEICVSGQWTFCNAPLPETEICDGKDNDCNGKVDDLPPKPCSGACGEGVAHCINGQWSGCSGPQPEPEICDGKDNDCNGLVDDNLVRSCKTACGSGTETCNNGQWENCNAPLPQPEICNGKDDDCDGYADNNAICPVGTVCQEGKCREPCRGGECKRGFKCIDGLCIGEACANIQCPDGQICLGERCVNPCDLITCQPPLKCSQGQCVRDDCYFKGCPSGQRCVNGECQKDPCTNHTCPPHQFCREGQCVSSCADIKCSDSEICVDGRCQNDPKTSGSCKDIQCPAGQFCNNGQCVGDPCDGVLCAEGRICNSGVCTHDPCHSIQCPAGQSCANGQCVKASPKDEQPILPQPTERYNPLVDAGNNTPYTDKDSGGIHGNDPSPPGSQPTGCVCSASSANAHTAILMFALCLLFAFRRRRFN
jgi:uncharacterized protein YegL